MSRAVWIRFTKASRVRHGGSRSEMRKCAHACAVWLATHKMLIGPSSFFILPSPFPVTTPPQAPPTLKVYYAVTQAETMLGWCTEDFTLYATFGPLVVKSAALTQMQKLLEGIRRDESALFITQPFTWPS